MANIIISELAGAGLFQDSESFLNELTDREMSIMGGGGYVVVTIYTNDNDNNNIDLSNVNITNNNSIKVRGKGKKKGWHKK